MNKTLSRRVAVLAAAILMTFVAGAPARAQQGGCLSDREIYAAVEEGTIAPLDDVLRANGIGRGTEVLSVKVCDRGGGYAYYVSVLDSYGEAQTLVLPASQ